MQLLNMHSQRCRDVEEANPFRRFQATYKHGAVNRLPLERSHGGGDYGYRVNLGCVEQVDAFALSITVFDGKSMLIAEDPGPHPSQDAGAEGNKIELWES